MQGDHAVSSQTITSSQGSLLQEEGYDCDSEELEALEDEAEEEEVDDEEIAQEVERAGLLYPTERVNALLEELKQEGLFQFLDLHVIGKTEAEIKALFIALGVLLPKTLRVGKVSPGFLISILKSVLIRHLHQRRKLDQYNTVDDAVRLISESKNIIVLSGSGISTSVGIPDFRSKDGIYAQLQREGKYNLADPQEMFDKDFFMHDPSCFFSFAKSIFPSNFVPSPSHRFIKLLEEKGSLLRNYTQNIDTLEQAAGIEKVLYCHGSFSKAQCTTPGCDYKVDGSVIKPDIFAQRVPQCPDCGESFKQRQSAVLSKNTNRNKRKWDQDSDDNSNDDNDEDDLRGLGVLKPCITFFGEKLSDEFDHSLLLDRKKVDLLIVMGTSLKVAPVSELVGHIPHQTPVILINKTPILHMGMDIQLLGNSDEIVEFLCNRLEWDLPIPEPNPNVVGGQSVAKEVEDVGQEVTIIERRDDIPKRVDLSHYWLFPGAEAESLKNILEESNQQEVDGSNSEEAERGSAKEAETMNSPLHRTAPTEVEDSRGMKRAASIPESTESIIKVQRHV